MNMHKNARLTPQGRLLLVHRITDQGRTVGSAAGAAGLPQRQAYRWLTRYRTVPTRCRPRAWPRSSTGASA